MKASDEKKITKKERMKAPASIKEIKSLTTIKVPDGLPGPTSAANPCFSAVIIPDASTSILPALMFTHLPCISPPAITLKLSYNSTLTVGELVTVSAAVSLAPFMMVSEFKLIVFLLKPSV